MKTIASTSFVFVVCVGCGVLSLGFGSCDGASSSGSGVGGDRDSGAADSSVRRDGGGSADTGSAFETGTLDTGTGAPDTGGMDSGFCGVPQTALGTTCDTCLETSCEPPWCACAAGAAEPDAGDGGSGCLQYVQCVEGCVQTDSGSPTDCITTVCAVSPFTTAQEQAGHAFLDCLVQYCGSDCGY